MIFPLAILVVVIMRNVIGVSTMGTFTPMLVAMALVKTGLVSGLVCFSVMILLGLIMRAMVAKLNLLLVPRISFVVIFVILLIQILTIVGYRMDYEIVSSAIFFPIIITAWIIERASITWEEDGAMNTIKEIFNTLSEYLKNNYGDIFGEYVDTDEKIEELKENYVTDPIEMGELFDSIDNVEISPFLNNESNIF